MTTHKWTAAQRRQRLRQRHFLNRPAEEMTSVVNGLVGLHSSDPVTVYLSAAARLADPTIESLYDQINGGNFVRHHAMRRTLWLFDHETAGQANAAATKRIAETEFRRLVKMLEERTSGAVTDGPAWIDSARSQVLDEFDKADEASMSTRELSKLLPDLCVGMEMAPGKSYNTTQSALTRLLPLMAFEATLRRGEPAANSWLNSQYRWSRTPEELFDTELEPPQAEAALARRWLYAFGPATAVDLKWWMGWTVATTKRALSEVGAVNVDLDGAEGWILADDLAPETPTDELAVNLLPGLDPTTMGWKERSWFLDPGHATTLFDRNGNAGPTIWVNGQVAGGWVQLSNGEIVTRLLDPVEGVTGSTEPPADPTAVEAEIERLTDQLQALLGDARFKVRFPAPLQKELYS